MKRLLGILFLIAAAVVFFGGGYFLLVLIFLAVGGIGDYATPIVLGCLWVVLCIGLMLGGVALVRRDVPAPRRIP